jgi:glycosyltransferase involved in cell wall biosynthesis
MGTSATGKVDFHLHSYASNVTDYYAANAFAIPESYSDPLELHRVLKRRGMSLVTLTDHNSIDGCLEMLSAGLPDVFLSAEMTTTFPEDGCNIHVTVANMTEAQFREVKRLRGNVYEMVAYVEQQIASQHLHPEGNRLAYFMTHPLMSTQNRPYGREGSLTLQHIEKALLLFPCLEVQNGARTRALNDLTLRLVRSLDQPRLGRLAERHGIEPRGETPWIKSIVGGSDDHSGINPGRTWTAFPHAGSRPTPNDVIDAIWRRESRPEGAHGGPLTLAHSILKLLYDGTNRTANRRALQGVVPGKRSVALGGPIYSLLALVFDADDQTTIERLAFHARGWVVRAVLPKIAALRGESEPFEAILESEAYALLSDPTFRASLAATGRTDDRIFLVVGTLLNRIFARYVRNLQTAGSPNLVRTIKEVVALVASNVFVSLPYFMSFVTQSTDCLIARDVRRAFDLGERPRVCLLTDTLFEVNGVSATIKRMMRESRARGIDFTVITSLTAEEERRHCADPEIRELIAAGRLHILRSVASLAFPEYEDLQVRFPPFLDLLKYLQESGCTKVQISTPGTIGLAGLLAAKALQVETAATYHTSIPEYVENYTNDLSLEALAWRYMILFYHSVDEVLVPSRFIAKLLHRRGLRNRKLLILDRWVDLARFHPDKRTPGFWRRFGVEDADDVVKFIYVGRVGVEKGLGLLADAYRRLVADHPNVRLFIVGDGPYRKQLQKQLAGLPVTFTGFLTGEDLPRAIASADAKLFPSTTDTWGNAPLEAQSSGLPVVVSDVGGPCELMVDGVTGLKVAGRDGDALLAAMVALLDPATRTRMGKAARAFVENNRVDEPFSAVLDSDAYRRRLHEAKHSPSESVRVWGRELLELGGAAAADEGEPTDLGRRGLWPAEVANA